MNKKLLVIVGSNNKNSITLDIVQRILKCIKKNCNEISNEVVELSSFKVNYCIGCNNCFFHGYCKLDTFDDFKHIRNKVLESDIIVFASPVYAHNISGIMKTFFDRISYYCHTFRLSKKIGFSITTALNSGEEYVSLYLMSMQTSLGIKNLDNFKFVRISNDINKFTENTAKKMIEMIKNNYGYSNLILERQFQILRDTYINTNCNSNIDKSNYEYRFWNQERVKNCITFQKFIELNKIIYKFK